MGIVAGIMLLGGAVVYYQFRAPAPLDAFASCLKEKGAVMYGTSWCPHCTRQKQMFGRSFRRAAYVECSMPGNPNAQAPVCQEQKITGYPTWIFADASRVSGVQELTALAEKTGCALPVRK